MLALVWLALLASRVFAVAPAPMPEEQLQPWFVQYANQYFGNVSTVQWPLLESVAWAESGFRADAQSVTGAEGLMQIEPATFRVIIRQVPELKGRSPLDPETNIHAGTWYLRHECWDRWPQIQSPQERLRFALASYNAGAGAVRRAWTKARQNELQGSWQAVTQHLSKQTVDYVAKIEARYQARLKELGALAGGRRERPIRESAWASGSAPAAVWPTRPATRKDNMEEVLQRVDRLFLLAGILLAVVYVPPWAFRRWQRELPIDPAEEIKGGNRLAARVVMVQIGGIFAVVIVGLLLLFK